MLAHALSSSPMVTQVAALGGGMPSDYAGYWVVSDYVTTPAPAVRNRAAAAGPKNITPAPRRLFGNGNLYSIIAGLTVTDANATAPDGSNDASTVVTAGSGAWAITSNPTTQVFPAGTWTAALSVRKVGATGAGTGRFGCGPDASLGTFTATASWQRFSQTFVSDGVTALNVKALMAPVGGWSGSTLEICDWCIYQGAADLLASDPVAVGHMKFGRGVGLTPPSAYANGAVSFGGVGDGHVQLPTASALTDAVTVLYLAKLTGTAASTLYNAIMSNRVSYSTFTVGKAVSDYWGMFWADGTRVTPAQATAENFEPGNSFSLIAITYERTTAKVYVNGTLMMTSTSAKAAINVRDIAIASVNGGNFSNYTLASAAIYGRVLSDAEVLQATRVMLADNPQITVPDTRAVIIEGDSISAALNGFAYIGFPNLSPAAHGPNLAVSGSDMTAVIARTPAVDAAIGRAVAAGRTPIVSLLIGANIFRTGAGTGASAAAQVAPWCDARRALGAKVVLGTVLPISYAGSVGDANVRRNDYNTIVRTWVGTHVDAIADFAADPIMGPDGASDNTTYYSDGLHPTAAGHVVLEPIWSGSVNGV